MRRNKKGFTLIELLAVIVILAVIALIAIPLIMNIINKANKSAFKDTAYGILSAGELYFAEQQLGEMSENVEFTFPTDEIKVKGNIPSGTKLRVNIKGETALAMSDGKYCITKGYSDNDITMVEEFENCNIPYILETVATTSTKVTSIASCLEYGTECATGTAFAIKVNDTETKDFYVIKDDGTTVTLMMSEKIGEKVAWYADADDNSYGPVTAIAHLDDLTDEEWNNISKKPYTYSGLAEDGKTRKYEDITKTMRARMITYEEANTIKIANGGTLPDYMSSNAGYWTSTVRHNSSTSAYGVGYNDSLAWDYVNRKYGVRPVIELSK